MNLPQEDNLVGRPLATIVDPRDAHILQGALLQVLNASRRSQDEGTAVSDDDGGVVVAGEVASGSLVHLRVVCGDGVSRRVGMTISVGSEGLVVVTRFYA